MFPRLPACATFVAGHKFCVRDTKNVSDFVQKYFVSATNVSQFAQPKKHHGQQFVRNNVSSFIRVVSMTSMSHKESRNARNRMWKITSGVFIAFFLRIALKKGRIINNLLTSPVRSLQGNLRPRPWCIDLAIARSIHQSLCLRFPCNDLTLG